MVKEILIEQLESGQESFEIMPFHIVKNWLESKGWIHLNEEFDTNGWQIDFWAYFAKPESYLIDKIIYQNKECERGKNLKSSQSEILMVSGYLHYGNEKISKL